ncbi:MAG: DUF362 domain-containing protein [Planctomycetes bacterium]|nr:DUF362 domain-containing protein [Planctomycetota bacterium]
MDTNVAMVKGEVKEYPKIPPFHPSERYPEYPFDGKCLTPGNGVYAAVRDLLQLLGLDKENFGTRRWNPLKTLVSPGQKVVIKPNFVQERETMSQMECTVTHGSVLRAIIDYIFIALDGRGEIVVADAPLVGSDFERIIQSVGLKEIARFYKDSHNFDIKIIDLRVEAVIYKGVIVKRYRLDGDPRGYRVVELGGESACAGIEQFSDRFRGSDYDREETILHHTRGKHGYYISQTILDADVIFNVPKLKTHMKTGVTLNLKNMIGINGDKNWIPHFRVGDPGQNGDEFPDAGVLRRYESLLEDRVKALAFSMPEWSLVFLGRLKNIQRKATDRLGLMPIRGGTWHGNDTLWRPVLDLNTILLYGSKDGKICTDRQRRYFSLIDGIVGGEGNGPLTPTPKPCGILIAGENPIATDLVAIRAMGLDYRKITKVTKAIALKKHPLMDFPLEEINCSHNIKDWDAVTPFLPPSGWLGHIELETGDIQPVLG